MKSVLEEIFGNRQTSTIYMLFERIRALFKGKLSFQTLISFFLILSQITGIMVFDWGLKPSGQKLDMSQFDLVWSDEFNGSEVDNSIWGGH